jgi:hypothetical protein
LAPTILASNIRDGEIHIEEEKRCRIVDKKTIKEKNKQNNEDTDV